MLPVSVVVHYDEQALGWAVANRVWVARALAEAAPGLIAETVNGMLREVDLIDPSQLRSTVGFYVVRPRPHVPVQMDLEVIMASDDLGELIRRLEQVRINLAARVLNWFHARHTEFPELYQRMQVTAIRVTLWVGGEILRLELNPATRQVIATEGGRQYRPGYVIG
ncbi:MAG TPA: hypothetical protein VJM32_00355 [Candidatus Saccharimonadales bacterium]|nr:hypothetical protein [Candidatus Saccharimonadales bacterium]